MLKAPLLLLGGLALASLASFAHACGGRLHIETGPTGVYRLGYADAVAAQPALADCAFDELLLRNRGEAVPLRVLDDGDGRFGPGDGIEWIGLELRGEQSRANPYSRNNVYELGAAPGSHPRFDARTPDTDVPAAPAGMSRELHLENDQMMIRLKTSQVPKGELPDLWYWSKLTMVDPQPFETRFDLPGLAATHAPVSLRLAFRGWSRAPTQKDHDKPADHRVQVELNGLRIGGLEWDGEAHEVRTLQLPPGTLRAHDNRLTLSVPSRPLPWAPDMPVVDVVMFDYLELDYPLERAAGDLPFRTERAGAPRVANGSAPELFGSDGILYQPVLHAGEAHYAAVTAGTRLFPLDPAQGPLTPVNLRAIADATDWRQPAQGYDYVIVAHPDLLDAVRPLVDFHDARGHRVALVNVDDIYDQFNHGITDPRAIRDFLAHGAAHWPAPALRYVLLVGDASFDLSDQRRDQKYYAKWADRELLMPGHFGTIPGTPYAERDIAPAARNLIPTFQYFSAEGQSASDNGFVDFGEDGAPALAIGRWPVIHPDEVKAIVDKTIAYVERPRFGAWRQSAMFITDDNPSFQTASDKLAEEVGGFGFNTARIYPRASDADNQAHQQAIQRGLDEGQLLVHFLGHGGRYIWRTGPPDLNKNHDLFTLDDVAGLSNAGRLPMVLSMTCYTAPFDNPTEDSIGERFLREPDNGAVAVFAASWRNWPDAKFSSELIADLLRPGVAIGDAILAAKRASKNRDMIEMYNLLGDPALVLQRPREQLRMARVDDRWSPRVAIAVPDAARFHGDLRVEWLDAKQNVLERHDYRIDTPSLTLPRAPAGATEVRAYALDPARSHDAIGGLKLEPLAATAPWWRRIRLPVRAKPMPPADDRIFGTYFED